MKTSTKPTRGKKVTKELSKVLTRLAGGIPARRRDEVSELLDGSDFAKYYVRCTWWGGCYYCQEWGGGWRIIECYAVAGTALG